MNAKTATHTLLADCLAVLGQIADREAYDDGDLVIGADERFGEGADRTLPEFIAETRAAVEKLQSDDADTSVTVVFGTTACRAYDDGSLNPEDMEGEMVTFAFKTAGETDAFLSGVDAADGWGDYRVMESDDTWMGGNRLEQ